MKCYLDLLQKVLDTGERRKNRTGIDTLSLFGEQIKIDLTEGFPLLTTKRIYFKGVIVELLWFLRGDTNIKFLTDNNVHIWDNWADKNGELGPVYGKQWRDWDGIDQIAECLRLLKEDPYSRRILLSSWNVGKIEAMSLPPCHILAQFYVRNNYIDCCVYQRSADIFLGVPFDIASYAALTQLFARECGREPGRLIYDFGDVHLYVNHIEQAKEQLQRRPGILPCLYIGGSGIDLRPEDFILGGYYPQPTIKAEVAI